jgi:hypothetical protein
LYALRQQASQLKIMALFFAEGGALVEVRVVQEYCALESAFERAAGAQGQVSKFGRLLMVSTRHLDYNLQELSIETCNSK